MPEYTTQPGRSVDQKKADLIVGQTLTGIPLPKPRKWLKGSQLWRVDFRNNSILAALAAWNGSDWPKRGRKKSRTLIYLDLA